MQCEGILAALVDAVASITGQDAGDVHTELDQHSLGASAARDDVRAFVARVETRLGLAPAVGRDARGPEHAYFRLAEDP